MKKITTALIIFVLLTAACHADIFNAKEGIRFEVPRGWRMAKRVDSHRVLKGPAYEFTNLKEKNPSHFLMTVAINKHDPQKAAKSDRLFKKAGLTIIKMNVKNAAAAKLIKKKTGEPMMIILTDKNFKKRYLVMFHNRWIDTTKEAKGVQKVIDTLELF